MNDRETGVLEQYDFEVKNIYKGRGMLIVETDQGLRTLKEFSGSVKKLAFQNAVLEHIKAAGMRSDFIVPNKEGELVSADKDGTRYLVREGYEARECNIRDEGEICFAVEHLARLHQVCRNISFSEDTDAENYRQDVREIVRRHNREMKKTRNHMRERRSKTDFEICFLKCFPEFYEKAEASEAAMDASGYGELSEEAAERHAVCHGSYNHHNVVFGRGRIITLDYEHCYAGVQIGDLYDFMRKVLEKWDWDVRLGRKILERYDRVLPITPQERTYLYLRFSYPEKFWKIANHYYNSRKSWIPDKNMEKLKILIGQEKKKEEFLRDLR